ncbi:MAG: hypothetical protein J2P28_24185 [Actinobacteria bacterium]|nr:hypothetical protein [Actinomycetota bacterium]MBO0838592.1 hypothetical protein [Actinomycetota bacterium]
MLPAGQDTADAARWWAAYQLAESDQVDELGRRAADGDEHARRHLASWLADRARPHEAAEVIRPLADAGDDVADLWLARSLADSGHVDELRQRAASGNYPALHELADWLDGYEEIDELRQLVVDHWDELAGWLSRPSSMRGTRLAAEFGDQAARRAIVRWLSRLRERAAARDVFAQQFLADNPDWRDYQPEWAD